MWAVLARVAVAAPGEGYSVNSSLPVLSIHEWPAEGKQMTQLGSARFEGDTWDLASSVGLTATMVAAARAGGGLPGRRRRRSHCQRPLRRAAGQSGGRGFLQPTADRRPVAVDLRDDWPAALREAGFDSAQPTAWSAEGLLGYLPAQAQDRLPDQVTAHSAPGSRFATEGLLDGNDLNREELRRRMRRQNERWNRHGFDLDMAALLYFDDRTDADTYLAAHGWRIAGVSNTELFARHGLPPVDGDDAPFGEVVYISAEFGG